MNPCGFLMLPSLRGAYGAASLSCPLPIFLVVVDTGLAAAVFLVAAGGYLMWYWLSDGNLVG